MSAQICGDMAGMDLRHLKKETKATKANPNKVISLYIETDLYTRNQLGSDAATEAWLEGLYMQLAENYAKEKISTSLTGTFWPSNTTEDWSPNYIGNDGILLNEFGKLRQDLPAGRVKHFVTMDGPLRGLAWIGLFDVGYFTSTNPQTGFVSHAGPYAISQGLSAASSSWNDIVLTHEMGHLIGSRHTSICVWGDGTQVIDMCGGVVEPLSDNNNCSTATLSPNAQDDTMMSNGNCNQSNIISNGFGVEPGELIRTEVNESNADLSGGFCAKLMYLADNVAGNYYATEDVIFHPGLDSEGMCVFIGCP